MNAHNDAIKSLSVSSDQHQPINLLDLDSVPFHAVQNHDGPIIVAYGAGVDSTAMLVEMVNRNIRPDLILFANTGAEKPETYAYKDMFSEWLVSKGFPAIETVQYKTSKAPYSDLEGNCIGNETLPSLAFGRHSCSIKWKADIQDYYVLGCKRGPNQCEPWAPAAEGYARGVKPLKLIGYDASPADLKRAKKAPTEAENFIYNYPLQTLGWSRSDCIAAIQTAGLPVPIKSACFFCPASKKWEILWLAATHPKLFRYALEMETNFIEGAWYRPDTKSPVKGLGRNWRWLDWMQEIGAMEGDQIIWPPAVLLNHARMLAPENNTNLQLAA